MRIQKNKGGFTLIELIVVITILAILGTIAFISLQGYSGDARNSKRLSDLASITSAINLKRVDGVGIIDLVDRGSLTSGLGDYEIGGDVAEGAAATNNIGLGGQLNIVDADYNSKYAAGVPNYSLLNIKKEEFEDPTGSEYLIGATTYGGERYQLAATKEVDGGVEAYLSGNYTQRLDSVGIDTGTTVAATTMTILNNVGFLKVGDTVDGDVTITKMTESLKSITFSGNPTLTDVGDDGDAIADELTLANPETTGLIRSVTNATTPITAGSTDVPYNL